MNPSGPRNQNEEVWGQSIDKHKQCQTKTQTFVYTRKKRWQRVGCLFVCSSKLLTLKASFQTFRLGIEHGVDAAQRARREFVVVPLVPAGGPGEHDVVAILTTRRARVIVLGIVLYRDREERGYDP